MTTPHDHDAPTAAEKLATAAAMLHAMSTNPDLDEAGPADLHAYLHDTPTAEQAPGTWTWLRVRLDATTGVAHVTHGPAGMTRDQASDAAEVAGARVRPADARDDTVYARVPGGMVAWALTPHTGDDARPAVIAWATDWARTVAAAGSNVELRYDHEA